MLSIFVATVVAQLVPANYPTMDKVPPSKPEWNAQFLNSVPAIAPRPPQAPSNDWTPYATHCSSTSDWGLTYDDGPSTLTPSLLTALKAKNVKSTFFVVGSRVIGNPRILKQAYDDGHQIGIHTWSHPYLTSLTNEQVVAEIMWTAQAIKEVIGVYPKYVRPPYGDIDARVAAILKNMGLTVTIWSKESLDTDVAKKAADVPDKFRQWVNSKQGDISLEHDLFDYQVNAAITSLDIVARAGFQIKTIASCLGRSDAYSNTLGGIASNTTTPTTTVTTAVPTSKTTGTAPQVTGNSSSGAMTIGSLLGLFVALL